MKKLLLCSLLFVPTLSFALIDSPDAVVSTLQDADIVAINATLSSCLDGDSSTFGMGQCLTTAIEASDNILNDVYRNKKNSLNRRNADSREVRSRLVNAERAWIRLRDAQCLYEGASELGGSAESGTIANCILNQTQQRIVALRNGA